MKNLEKRAVYFFDRLAMLISEDPEVRDVLHYYRRFTDMFARFKADTSVSEESKDFIASRVFNHRIFSREWDARYGNLPDPMLIRP